MLGQINEWFYLDLDGIEPDPAGPAIQQTIIRPAVVGDLTCVRSGYDSVRGRITSAWKRDGRRLTLEVTIPPNTTATVLCASGGCGLGQQGRRGGRALAGCALSPNGRLRSGFRGHFRQYVFASNLPEAPAAR